MTKLSDEQLRALEVLARHPDGCAEAVLLVDGFHVGQLAVLVFDGLAEMQRTVTDIGGRQRTVAWIKITEEGRKARSQNEKVPRQWVYRTLKKTPQATPFPPPPKCLPAAESQPPPIQGGMLSERERSSRPPTWRPDRRR
jgi:hypothetical protein